MNPFYNVWNINYIQQQAQQQYHQHQIYQVTDAMHKLQEFLDAVDKADSNYQGALNAGLCGILSNYINKHNIR